MVERVCPRCERGNPSEQAYCGDCGMFLQDSVAPLAQRPIASLTQRPVAIPAQWKQAGKVVALGVATLAAEAGMAWLQRRQQPLARTTAQSPAKNARVIAVGHRIRTTWRNGQLYERVDEQVLWMTGDDAQR